MKDERSFKVILKNIQPLINIEKLKQDINSKDHTIINIWNVQRKNTKESLFMFFVKLKPVANNKDIYNINFLLQSKKLNFLIQNKISPHMRREIP